MSSFKKLAKVAIRGLSFVVANISYVLITAVFSIAVSLLSFTLPTLSGAMAGAAKTLFGAEVVFLAKDVDELRRRNGLLTAERNELRQSNRQLTSEATTARASKESLESRNRELETKNRSLETRNQDIQRQTAGWEAERRDLERRNGDLRSQNVDLKARNATLSDASTRFKTRGSQVIRRVERRIFRAAMRSMAAIPLESVPIIGVGTIFIVTILEAYDGCSNLTDMNELYEIVGGSIEQGSLHKVCTALPLFKLRAERFRQMTISECKAEAKREEEEIRALAMKTKELYEGDEFNEAEFDRETDLEVQRIFESTNEICDCIGDVNCSLDEILD